MANKFRYSLKVGPLDDLVMPTLPALSAPEATKQKHIDRSFADSIPTGGDNDPGFLSRVFDVVSRPLYAVSNVVKDTIDQTEGTDNPFESFWAGFSGLDKTTGADILDQITTSSGGDITFGDAAKGSLGFAWDVGADPLNFVPGAKIAKTIGKGLKTADEVLSGDRKIARALADNVESASKRHTEEDVLARGGQTYRLSEGEIVPDAGRAEPAPSRLPDIEVPEGTAGNPRAQGAGYQPPEFLREVLGPVNPRNESGAFPMGTGSDAFTPKVMAPSTDLTEAASVAKQAEDAFDGPVGRNARGQVYIKDKNGMTIAVREQAPPDPLQLAPARKELMPGNLETKPPRTFEVGMPTKQGWDLTPNDIPQSYQLADITKQARESLPLFEELTPMQKKFAVQARIENDLKAAKDADMAAGNAPVVRFDGEDYHLHMADVVDSIPAKDFARMHLNLKAGIPPSSILHGAAAVLKASNLGLKEENLFAFVRDAMMKANKTSRRISETELKRAINSLVQARPKLQYHLIHNEKMILKSDYMAGKSVGNAVAREIKADLVNPRTSYSKELVRVADLYGNIGRQIRAGGAAPGEAMAAGQTAREALGGVLDDLDVAAARDTLAMGKAAQRGNEVALRRRALETYTRDSTALAKVSEQNANDFTRAMAAGQKPGEAISAPPDLFADLADRQIDDFLNGFNRMYRSARQKFVAAAGQGKFQGIRRMSNAVAGMLHASFQRDLQQLEKDFGRKGVEDAFNHIQHGVNPAAMSEADRKVYDALYPKIKHFFDPQGGFVDNAVLRSGLTSEGFDAMAKARGLPWLELTKLAKYKGEPLAQIWLREGKNLAVKDPMDFMAKFHGMAVDASVLSAMARHAESLGRSSAAKGYSRIATSAKFDEAPVSHFIDPERYIPDEIIEQLRQANQEILKPINWGKQNTPMAKFMNKVFDPMMRAWKTFATILRPGHHIANMMGDTLVNYMAGVRAVDYKYANEALRSIGLVGRQTYEALESALYTGIRQGAYKSPKAAEHAFDVTLKGGKKVPHTYGQLGEKMFRHGGLSDFRVLEDIDTATKSPINAFTDRVINSRYGSILEKFSEWNANTQRAAQVFNRMRDAKFTGKFDTEEEAWFAAIEDALKAHPDSAGLAAFEKKWGRRVIPFYSYNRQILPWVVTNFVAHPGRAMVIPKAQYNLLIAAGQDPESLSYPYTNDNVLPPWALSMLSGNIMGDPNQPQGMNFGYSLSGPLDTLSDWTNQSGQGGNPLPAFGKQLVSSLNPIGTLPFDLFNSAKDKSEEIDERIPGAATFKSITGISPTGTIGNAASGNLQVDQTRQVQQGKREALFNEAMINFFSGLKLQDFSDYSGFNKPQVRTSNR